MTTFSLKEGEKEYSQTKSIKEARQWLSQRGEDERSVVQKFSATKWELIANTSDDLFSIPKLSRMRRLDSESMLRATFKFREKRGIRMSKYLRRDSDSYMCHNGHSVCAVLLGDGPPIPKFFSNKKELKNPLEDIAEFPDIHAYLNGINSWSRQIEFDIPRLYECVQISLKSWNASGITEKPRAEFIESIRGIQTRFDGDDSEGRSVAFDLTAGVNEETAVNIGTFSLQDVSNAMEILYRLGDSEGFLMTAKDFTGTKVLILGTDKCRVITASFQE